MFIVKDILKSILIKIMNFNKLLKSTKIYHETISEITIFTNIWNLGISVFVNII